MNKVSVYYPYYDVIADISTPRDKVQSLCSDINYKDGVKERLWLYDEVSEPFPQNSTNRGSR